jgi:hypothetical protein
MQLEAHWIVGFTDGEGCFHVGIARHPELRSGVQVLPEFVIVQHKRNVRVLHALKQFFGCGVVRSNHGDRLCWRVRKLEHLRERVIPFFERHPLKTLKRQDFISFRQVVHLMGTGQHLTTEGVQRIRRIVERMNTGRLEEVGKVKSSPPRKRPGQAERSSLSGKFRRA